MPPGNNWFHCNGNTYGTWLRGDPRGWRSSGHHEHVDGDYKSPPPKDKYRAQFEQSKRSMKRDPVDLPWDARRAALEAMVESLLFRHVEVLAFCVGAEHWHGLLRFNPLDPRKSRAIAIAGFARNRTPRRLLGIAKKRAARAISEMGLVDQGGVWAGRGGVKPITDRTHQVNVYKYIRDNIDEGAAIYTLLNGFEGPIPRSQRKPRKRKTR